jgi:6-pyruvoyltetrahydropterin/6-carboxytetrahydropterin synthase
MAETNFRAAHGLVLTDGSREEPHSHLWRVLAAVQCTHLNKVQMGMDFHELKALLEETVAVLADRPLEEHRAFASVNPTAEMVAKFVYDRLAPKVPPPAKLAWVEITEAPGCTVRYTA